MKITVEISDEWIEEDQLTHAIKSSIINDVTGAVKSLVKEQVEKEIVTVVKDTIIHVVAETSDQVVREFLETGMITISGKEVLAKDHMRQIFQSHSGWSNPSKQVEVLADKWAKELKAKYDGAFVTHLVQRINLSGMLKPEVAQLLLGDNDQTKP